MVYRSYKDWQQAGYNVIKGEKACARTVNGEVLFSEQQVTPLVAKTTQRTSYNTGGIVTSSEGFKGHYHSEEYNEAMYG